jgi:hypothetical protein
MSKFITELDVKEINDSVWMLDSPLIFESDLCGKIVVLAGFQTDFASVPRLPIFFTLFGDRAHCEAVLHDYLYRIDSVPEVCRSEADKVFLEAMECRGKKCHVRWPMYWGVRLGGWSAYHKRLISDKLS